jgi:hypothetical protein
MAELLQGMPSSIEPDRSTSIEIEKFGGKPSPLGANYALAPDSFTKIGGDPCSVVFSRRQLVLSSEILWIFSSIKRSPTSFTRLQSVNGFTGKVSRVLEAEVIELYHTIKMFTFAFPERLAPIYNAQRERWASKWEDRSKRDEQKWEALIFAQRQLELSRLLLNILAQLKDERGRKVYRCKLRKEVDLLIFHIKSFCMDFPIHLTELFKAEDDFSRTVAPQFRLREI